MPARKPPVIPAHETDVYRLLHGFEQRVAAGQVLGFATFKSLWQDMHFSHIFEVQLLKNFRSYRTAGCLQQACRFIASRSCSSCFLLPSALQVVMFVSGSAAP